MKMGLKQAKIIDSSYQGGILTLRMDGSAGKIGQSVDLEFDNEFISGKVIKKLGKTLKVRVSSIIKKCD